MPRVMSGSSRADAGRPVWVRGEAAVAGAEAAAGVAPDVLRGRAKRRSQMQEPSMIITAAQSCSVHAVAWTGSTAKWTCGAHEAHTLSDAAPKRVAFEYEIHRRHRPAFHSSAHHLLDCEQAPPRRSSSVRLVTHGRRKAIRKDGCRPLEALSRRDVAPRGYGAHHYRVQQPHVRRVEAS
eukprot:3993133-Prymnesium_polylepis.1